MVEFAMKMGVEKKSTNSTVRSVNRFAGQENRTGIPTQLKERLEQSTGLSLDDVRVHYNSALPAKLDALAYIKGNQVEIGPGQERHLPYELGRVVQQKLGAVRANAIHSSGVALNTDVRLEHQAGEIGFGKGVDIVQKMGDNVIQRFDPIDTELTKDQMAQIENDRKKQKDAISTIENNTLSLNNSKVKGIYGEMKMDSWYESKGYIRINDNRVTDFKASTQQGIDGVYYHPSLKPKLIIAEAKFNKGKTTKRRSGIMQMGPLWIKNNLEKAVGKSAASKILESSKNEGEVERHLVNILPTGEVSVKKLESLTGGIDMAAQDELDRITPPGKKSVYAKKKL